jgi:hypothetical protein
MYININIAIGYIDWISFSLSILNSLFNLSIAIWGLRQQSKKEEIEDEINEMKDKIMTNFGDEIKIIKKIQADQKLEIKNLKKTSPIKNEPCDD